MIKYFLYLDSSNVGSSDAAVLALRYSAEKGLFVIGGYSRFELQMCEIIDTFFAFDADKYARCVQRNSVQKNKIQFILSSITSQDAFRVFAEMRKAGFTLARTTTFLNLMR